MSEDEVKNSLESSESNNETMTNNFSSKNSFQDSQTLKNFFKFSVFLEKLKIPKGPCKKSSIHEKSKLPQAVVTRLLEISLSSKIDLNAQYKNKNISERQEKYGTSIYHNKIETTSTKIDECSILEIKYGNTSNPDINSKKSFNKLKQGCEIVV